MSVAVPLDSLRAALAERGDGAYLLTVGDDASPHAVHLRVIWEGEGLAVEVGRRSAANAAARPTVSLLFPVRTDGDYSLIVDGTAVVVAGAEGTRLRITPMRAVMHRAAAVPDPTSSCGADCVPLLSPSPPAGPTRR